RPVSPWSAWRSSGRWQTGRVTLTVNWGPDQISREPSTSAVPALRSLAIRPTLPGQGPLGFGGQDTALFTTTVTHEWTEDFRTIVEADQAFQNAVPGLGPGGRPQNASWY